MIHFNPLTADYADFADVFIRVICVIRGQESLFHFFGCGCPALGPSVVNFLHPDLLALRAAFTLVTAGVAGGLFSARVREILKNLLAVFRAPTVCPGDPAHPGASPADRMPHRNPRAQHQQRRFPATVRVSLGAMVGVGLFLPSIVAADEAIRRGFDIPAGDAEVTLKQFAAQSGEQLLYSPDDVSGVRTHAVLGEFTPMVALEHMLKGTPLKARQDGKTKAIAITAVVAPHAAPRSTAPTESSPAWQPQKPSEEPPKNMKRKNPIALLGAWLALTMGSTNILAQATPTPPVPKAPIIELSPFQVDASRDTGYHVQHDVTATRLNADLRDIAAAVTVFTKDFMNDINAVNVFEMVQFAPNADISELNMDGKDVLPNPVRMRGIGANNPGTQDFFMIYDDQDMYKGDRITINRGPNSLLVGIGDPVGATTLVTKQAGLGKNEYEFTTRFDNWRSARATFDANVVLAPGRAAARAVILQQRLTGAIKPTSRKDKRLFLTGTAKLVDRPGFKTSVRGYYEWIDGDDLWGNGILPYERFSIWRDAGSPIVTNPQAPVLTSGTLRYTTANKLLLVTGPQNPIPVMNWRNMVVSNGPASRPILDEAVYPYDKDIKGPDAPAPRRIDQGAVFIEQQVGRNLYIEIAAAHAAEDRISLLGGGQTIFVDPNGVLPDGSPNPNAGKLYVETNARASSTGRVGSTDTVRIGASYKFDFSDINPTLGKWLGRHTAYGLYEEFEKNETLESLGFVNTTPLPGFPTLLSNAQNHVAIRSYLDVANGVYSFRPGNLFNPRDVNGMQIEKLRVTLQRRSVAEIDTKVVALMSHFWENRIVTTLGWREDHAINYSSPAAGQPGNLADARGVFNHPKTLPVGKQLEGSFRPVNLGVMVHPLKWLSFGYNDSENFTGLSSNQYSIFKQLHTPSQGMGKDYAVRVHPFGDKMSMTFSYYESGFVGSRNVLPSSVLPRINAIWETLGRAEDGFVGLDVRALSDFTSQGWETSITYNPTSNWRIYATVSKNHTTFNNIFPEVRAYLDQKKPIWQQSGNTPVASGPDNGLTINQSVDNIENLELATRFAGDGAPLMAQREWNGSFVTNYTFTDGRLRGFYIGGNLLYRGKMVTNYPSVGGVPQLDNPYFERAYINIGVNLGYMRTYGKYTWKTQLGLQNVNHPRGNVVIFLNDNDGVPARGRWEQGLTAVWTNSLRF